MIIDSPKTTIHQNTQTQSTPFTIELNAITFEILSRDLYKNPIKAIIRELCCNAIDSHKRAENPAPFDIHLPTTDEPYLTVQDYGTGLSRESMEVLYTGYFKSDKRGTNDEIGGKGLGSKTPLAYADTFSVVSCYNGEKHAYAVHKNADGLPTLTHIFSSPTDERNGLNITLAVAEKDIYKFITEAKNILPWMPYRITNTLLNFSIQEPVALFAKKPFQLLGRKNRPLSKQQAHLLMGNVVYPIDTTLFSYSYRINQALQDSGLIIELPIGSVDVTAGRDELLYSEKTLNALKPMLDNAYEWIETTIRDEIQKQPNLFNAKKKLHELIAALCHHPLLFNCLELSYFDQTTETRHPISIHEAPKTQIPGLVYHIKRRRSAFTAETTNILKYDEGITLCHSIHPTTKAAILRDGNFSDDTYLLISENEKEIREFYALVEATENDVSDLFNPKKREARKKATQQPKSYRRLDSQYKEYVSNGEPPDDALILQKEGSSYLIAPNKCYPVNSATAILSYLERTIPNCPEIVVVSKSTPKYGYPKNGKKLEEVLRDTLQNRHKNLTIEKALVHQALAWLNEKFSHNVPHQATVMQDLEILHAWNLAPINIYSLRKCSIHSTLVSLLNTIKAPK